MEALQPTKRYEAVTREKSGGATYTPKVLADFVAQQIVETASQRLLRPSERPLRILDPAIGHGELLVSLLEHIPDQPELDIQVYGFETDPEALHIATKRLEARFPGVAFHFEDSNFLEFALENFGADDQGSLFHANTPEAYDLIIANPPYVRTQIMGTVQAQLLAEQFGLSGRVDLYYAFILGMSQVLQPEGIAGIIVSNRFMTTKSGTAIRQALFDRFNIRHTWDLGDTKLFGAAVLPAVLLVEGKEGQKTVPPAFSSIYQTDAQATKTSTNPITALSHEGIIEVSDGRCFHVQHGKLDTNGTSSGVWRIATDTADAWLTTVENHTWGTFRDIGKIRVGVKTCADKIYIRKDWEDMPAAERPELLKPLTTHHIARRFKPLMPDRPSQILYTHEVVQGRRRAINLETYPRSKDYLDKHRHTLEGRKYVIKAGREWYEVWVPQDPDAWNEPKLVFRDIAEEPTFWVDLDGSVVNGDCYWLISQNPTQTELLWLAAAVGNSTFIERFYDLRFNNKLYSGRRRFITQYVENFPLPDPETPLSKAIVDKAKLIYEKTPSPEAEQLQKELNTMIWEAMTGSAADPTRV
tara:strand:- start:4930 stop:6678 length:1749 start_codon:yes stop_codon:yes gene_type:complete